MARQLSLALPSTWGGKRKGAGRKPKGVRAGVSHHMRPFHERAHPVHVTLRARRDLPSLREWRPAVAIGKAFRASEKPAFRVIHFSIQPDHIHIIVEAHDRVALARGMQGVVSRLARYINRAIDRRGSVFADRYHARPLQTAREVRNALAYVLLNHRKHTDWGPGLDPYSSGAWFTGWNDGPPPLERPGPIARPRTWLARRAWRRHGLIRLDEGPRP